MFAFNVLEAECSSSEYFMTEREPGGETQSPHSVNQVSTSYHAGARCYLSGTIRNATHYQMN